MARRAAKPRNYGTKTQVALPRNHEWARYAVLALCVLYAVILLRDFIGLLAIVRFPADVNFGEGLLLYDAQRVSRGLPLYKPLKESPYWFSNYPPLFTWLASLGSSSFIWPRTISLLSSLFCAGTLAFMVWRITRAVPAAFLAAALWLVLPFVGPWSAVARVDMLGRALQSAAVLLVWLSPAGGMTAAGAVLLAAAAMLTKQTLIAGALTCFGILWFRSKKRAAIFAIAWFVCVAILYAVLTAATGGWFWHNVFRAMQRDVHGRFLAEWVWGYALSCWPLIISSAIIWRKAWRSEASRVFLLATLAAVPHLLLAASDGADRNYFFDLNWALCGLSGVAISRIASDTAWKRGLQFAVYAAMGVLLLISSSRAYPTKAQAASASAMLQQMRNRKKPLLCELPGFTVLGGGEPDYLPYMLKKVEERGQFDSSPVLDKIRRAEYGAILLTQMAPARFPQTMLDAINERYSVSAADPGAFMIDGNFGHFLLTPD